MWKAFSLALITGLCGSAWADARLTPMENRWLAAAAPVLSYARQQKLPLDIVVQPTDQPGRAPLAMGFVGGRCKLVLSMRGNPAADHSLDGLSPELIEPVIEAVTAHELGHCWRYVQGAWHTVPAGFVDASGARPAEDADLAEARRHMHETRREEGFADLVGLAWALNRHPEHYARVHAWFHQVRDEPLAGSHHDTRAWVRLVRDPSAFAVGATPFEQVMSLWQRGLANAD